MEQPSPTPVARQSAHPLPDEPQVLAERVLQRLPLQQPLGHEVASHVQTPPTQRWPSTHGAPLPHVQLPLEHPSDRRSHATHAPPSVPHALAPGLTQLDPEQHPEAQVVALQSEQAPATQTPEAHVVHALPPLPHAAVVPPGMHSVPAQQPPHEVASQTHAPPTQCWPAEHAGPAPQAQLPAVQRSADAGSHATHAAPGAPHVAGALVSQRDPAQHPAHELASQTQAPETQCCPATHAAPAPHAHVPALEHRSASVASQLEHASPPAPHAVSPGAVQVVPAQHPAHERASHTQVPPTQACPTAHGAPVPHAHAPLASQASARSGSHATHAPPPMPHVLGLAALHVAPEQQPVVQPAAQPLHTPDVQAPPPHDSQAPPPLPHAPASVPG